MPSPWDLPLEEEEKELHLSRLLNVEEKPFKRVTKRINTFNTLVQEQAHQPMTPPPDGTTAPSEVSNRDEKQMREDLAVTKEDIILDFSAFDSSIARIQFLMDANTRERQRYAADKGRIMEEAQAVRESNANLRVQLEQAKAKLAKRRMFDEMADRITRARVLRPREEQKANLKKLDDECEELERESKSYAATWRERRDQFNKIIEEGQQLRRLIRDEKDDWDRREGMEEEGEEEGETTASVGGQTPRHVSHGNASPNPEGVLQSQSRGGETPRPQSPSGRSNRDHSPGGDRPNGLRPPPARLGELSRSSSRVPSRDVSPTRGEDEGEIEEGEDVETDGPRISVNSPGAGERMDTT